MNEIVLIFTMVITNYISLKYSSQIKTSLRRVIKTNAKAYSMNKGYAVNVKPFEDNKSHWSSKNRLIAHAMGGVDGRTYTNCKEALILSYERGMRVFEADTLITSDGHLIFWHEFADFGAPTFEEYHVTKLQYKYTPLLLSDIIRFLSCYENTYILIDSKKFMSSLVCAVLLKEIENEELYERFIIQIASEEEYRNIAQMDKFKNFHYILANMQNLKEQFAFLRNAGIETVSINYKLAQNEKVMSLVKLYSMKAYAYAPFENVLNDLRFIKKILEGGFWGAFVETVTYEDLEIVMKDMNKIKQRGV
jgi:glycerophosphoryl diester phosphodiesterase